MPYKRFFRSGLASAISVLVLRRLYHIKLVMLHNQLLCHLVIAQFGIKTSLSWIDVQPIEFLRSAEEVREVIP
jgi:hypothetical protein